MDALNQAEISRFSLALLIEAGAKALNKAVKYDYRIAQFETK
jgi:hypothetical protein